MSPETPTPRSSTNPEMFVIPTASTDALEQARIDAEGFKNNVIEANRTFIDVADVPKAAEQIEVQHGEAARRDIGHTVVEHARKSVSVENATPQMMANAIGSLYYQDRLGRIAPKQEQ